jgi:HPt (histidine-containing phosphotransfer) domain-containing protein
MIDWDRVSELREEVGAEDFQEVVAIFLEEADEVIDRLAEAPETANLEADFHALKGAALNLGFKDFAAICAHQEKLAAQGKDEEVDVIEVLSAYAAAKDVFNDGLAGLDAA